MLCLRPTLEGSVEAISDALYKLGKSYEVKVNIIGSGEGITKLTQP